ncbi:MAG: ABC-F family ATP-binding cassette domain-containing protein [Pseudomonadota bacterium]
MLHINDLTYRIQGEPLLEKATVAVHSGERVGLVGRNGSGKTTLLKLIMGQLQSDEGTVSLPNQIRLGTVAQDAPAGEDSLLETVLAADQERSRLLEALEAPQSPEDLAEIHERLNAIQADSAPARAARILAGLGFDAAAQARPCREFSGGWRMRVALAALLFSEPDFLLLDEPTNHLDLEAALWLEGFLARYPGTFLMVSHDRGLLNRAVNRIIHLEGRKLISYQGNYDRFEKTRRERLVLQEAMRVKQEAQRRHIQAFIDRFRYKASKARQAQSRVKALARMEPIASVIEDRTTTFQFPDPDALAPPIITTHDGAVGYVDGQPVLTGLNLRLDMDDRVALLGANGNGKSTLARLLSGRLQVMGGELTRSSKLRVGYFSQDQTEELDVDSTPLEHLSRLQPGQPPVKLRSQLARFGFGHDRAEVQAGKLSGGEKARLLFALMTRDEPHLLILDEPTNHLDVDARQALIQALGAFSGAVVLISHDPHLVELAADRLWLVADGGVSPFEGDMDDYRQHLMEQRRRERGQERDQARADKPEKSDGLSKKDKRRAAAAARAATADLAKAVKDAERRIEKLTAQRQTLEQKLADPEVYNGPTAKLMDLQVRHGELKAAIETAEAEWLNAQAALEDA